MARERSGISTVDRVGEHGSAAMYHRGCRCDVCRLFYSDRSFEYRLRAKLEKLRDEGFEDWEIELERIAQEIKRFTKRRLAS